MISVRSRLVNTLHPFDNLSQAACGLECPCSQFRTGLIQS